MAKTPKYRSGLERKVAKTLDARFEFESIKLPYVLPHNYIPDFVDETRKEIIECKGRFPASDRTKMKAVRAAYPDWTITMIFTNPKTPINKGSKTTYGDWCDKIGIHWRKA